MWRRRLFSSSLKIVEVGPRDGLQNERAPALSLAVRAELIKRLIKAGMRHIEVGSFVSPRWVPQMADTGSLLDLLKDQKGSANFSVLVPNEKGLEEALQSAAVDEIAVFTAASETFSQRNTNCSIAESLKRIKKILSLRPPNIRARGYISTVLGCPYEGRTIDASRVAALTETLLEAGCAEVSLGDTIGVGRAAEVRQLLKAVSERIGEGPMTERVAVHFHDTYGQALANVRVALDCGIRIVDASVAGLGGCPYAPGATGNLATEDLVYMLIGEDLSGIDLDALIDAGQYICKALGRKNSSRAAMAILSKRID